MKVKDLIKELGKHDAEREVHISIDSEGNAIKTIYEIVDYQDGNFVEAKVGENHTDIINGKKLRWEDTNSYITIFPTDDIVCT